MKWVPGFALMIVCSYAYTTVWTDHKGLTIKAQRYRGVQDLKKNLSFKLRGGVEVTSTVDGISISADQIDAEATPGPPDGKSYHLAHATANENVRIVKTVVSSSGKQTTRIQGPKAEYFAGTTESSAKIIGPTNIQTIDESQHQTMVATGSSGIAYLDPSVHVSGGNGMRRAILQGPVKIVLNQSATKSANASVTTATAKQMTIQNIDTSQRVTLLGSVHIVGTDAGEASGMDKAVFVLNKNHHWQLDATGEK